jgi:hypothetical protein
MHQLIYIDAIGVTCIHATSMIKRSLMVESAAKAGGLELEGNRALQFDVLGFIDDTHTSGTQSFSDFGV